MIGEIETSISGGGEKKKGISLVHQHTLNKSPTDDALARMSENNTARGSLAATAGGITAHRDSLVEEEAFDMVSTRMVESIDLACTGAQHHIFSRLERILEPRFF